MSTTLVDAGQCSPRIIKVDESCGCTLTRASISAMTPQSFEDQAAKEVGMDRIIAQAKEARATGVKESPLSDLLMSKMFPVKQTNLAAGSNQSVIAPFFLRPQRHRINSNYFEVVTGSLTSGAGSGGVHYGSWDLIVRNHQGTFKTNLAGLEAYFLVGMYVIVLHKSANGTSRSIQYKVKASVNSDSGGVNRATLTLEPTDVSSATYNGYTTDEKAPYKPTSGLVIPLTNSVSNYESWCYNQPSENTMKLLSYWWQTHRETHCYNDAYLEALNAPLTSQYFKRFKQIPLAEQRKIQAMRSDRLWKNTLFWGQRISDGQTVEGYSNPDTGLPTVEDPAVSGCVLEYKANTIGYRQQLADCGRVTDYLGNQLNLDTLFSTLYTLKRTREQDSGTIDVIDGLTDRFTANSIRTLMIDYYKKKYQTDTHRYYNVGEAIKFQNQVLWNYDRYQIPESGVDFCVIHDPYFDDQLAAQPSASRSVSRRLMMLDFSDIGVAVGGTRSVKRQTNIADDLYNCTIDQNVKHYMLTSKTFAAVIEDPNRHAIIENFAEGCAYLTGATPCHAS